jgi:hypothetical protein
MNLLLQRLPVAKFLCVARLSESLPCRPRLIKRPPFCSSAIVFVWGISGESVLCPVRLP